MSIAKDVLGFVGGRLSAIEKSLSDVSRGLDERRKELRELSFRKRELEVKESESKARLEKLNRSLEREDVKDKREKVKDEIVSEQIVRDNVLSEIKDISEEEEEAARRVKEEQERFEAFKKQRATERKYRSYVLSVPPGYEPLKFEEWKSLNMPFRVTGEEEYYGVDITSKVVRPRYKPNYPVPSHKEFVKSLSKRKRVDVSKYYRVSYGKSSRVRKHRRARPLHKKNRRWG